MEAYEPKWVNSILNTIRVNSLRLGGLHVSFIIIKLWFLIFNFFQFKTNIKTEPENLSERSSFLPNSDNPTQPPLKKVKLEENFDVKDQDCISNVSIYLFIFNINTVYWGLKAPSIALWVNIPTKKSQTGNILGTRLY